MSVVVWEAEGEEGVVGNEEAELTFSGGCAV